MVFKSYSKYYEILYADKEYEKECDFIEKIFREYSTFMPKTILDAGCGIGGHAIPLARRGYQVTGIDASAAMIEIAIKKAEESGANIDFFIADLRKLRLGRKFDACICMFTVIGYITENKDISKVLSNVRSCLRDEGLFVFDFWYGPAVLTILPSVRKKIVKGEDVKVIRFAEPRLDTLRHLCEIDYCLIVNRGNTIVEEVKETHRIRFIFPQEIRHYLEETGFELLRLCSFLDADSEPSEKSWNVTAISKAV